MALLEILLGISPSLFKYRHLQLCLQKAESLPCIYLLFRIKEILSVSMLHQELGFCYYAWRPIKLLWHCVVKIAHWDWTWIHFQPHHNTFKYHKCMILCFVICLFAQCYLSETALKGLIISLVVNSSKEYSQSLLIKFLLLLHCSFTCSWLTKISIILNVEQQSRRTIPNNQLTMGTQYGKMESWCYVDTDCPVTFGKVTESQNS